MQTEFGIKFQIQKNGELFYAENDEKKVMSCTAEAGCLSVWILYDYKIGEPLFLRGAANLGDSAEIRVYAHRIELYVNGVQVDEEWPCGAHFVSEENLIGAGCTVCMNRLKRESTEMRDTVLGCFQNAEGWKPEKNIHVGDCMPYVYDGRYHVLYLKDRHHHKSKWGLGAHQWSHISTKDFLNWEIHPMAVKIDDPSEGSICTGSWIYAKNRHYLFYTVRTCDNSPSKICRSVSEDGYHFEKDRNFHFTLSDRYEAASARDPKVIRDADGLYHMVLTTSLKSLGVGCLAHLISENMEHWREVDEPLYVTADGWEPECPDYFYLNGFYYLVFSVKGKAHYRYSKKPFSDWQVPKNPVIPCQTVPKAAIWNGRLIFVGFHAEEGYAGTMTFLEALSEAGGALGYRTEPVR